MTNEEKLREIFPKTIFIYRKEGDKTTAIQCSDEWLNAEYKEPKTGHWIGPKDIMWENPKCSECGFESADHDNYCPHCGVNMRGE